MVDIMDKLQKISEMGKTTRDKQRLINVNEVFYVWDILVTKLDIMEHIQLIDNFIEDADLKIISHRVVKNLQAGIKSMEELMNDYGIPFPTRPPADINTGTKLEFVTDRFIFQSLFEGVQAFFPTLASGFMNTTSPKVRKAFKNHLLVTIELQEIMVEYGKLKGYLNEPPVYRA